MAPKVDPWVRTFSVSDPVRHKKGYTVYKVTSKVFPRNSPEAATEIIVWKRYSDFKKLHKNLQLLHSKLYLKGSFPAFAKGRLFGRFEENVVEERRQSALRLLEFVAFQPPLFNSQLFVKFFEDGERRNPERISESERDKTPILQPPNPEEIKQDNSLIQPPNSEETNRTLSLSGIWQYRQDQESISVSSGSSGTTPTDDDSTLSLFDPLRSTPVEKESCSSSWFLAALKACNSDGYSANSGSGSIPSPLPYPKPFAEFDDTPPSAGALLTDITSKPYIDWDAHIPLDSKLPNVLATAEADVNSTISHESKELQEHGGDEYIITAANAISLANEYEAEAKYKEAFNLYKSGVGSLLAGVKTDSNETRRDAVSRKMVQYLTRAEEIYTKFLAKPDPETKEQNQLCINKEPLMGMLQAPTSDLRNYRVLGILDKVLLVLDITTEQTCAMKVLHKASSAHLLSVPSVVPSKHRFMVQLYKFIETDYAIFLVLQHASGGKLWQYVKNYLQNSPSSPGHGYSGCEQLVIHIDQVPTNSKNVYSGKKLLGDVEKEKTLADAAAAAAADLVATPECASSYVELFTNYAASLPAGKVVELAKCNIKSTFTEEECKKTDISPVASTSSLRDTESNSDVELSPCNKQVVFKSSLSLQDLNSDDLIIHAQELIHNVDETIRESQRDNSKQVLAKSPSKSVDVTVSEQNRRPNKRRNPTVLARQHSEDSAFSSPVHEARRSSSTGSLPTAVRQRKRYLSEVFAQLDETNSREMRLPESCIRTWAAEIIIAISQLHSLGIICRDLCPDNILLGRRGHVLLTHFGQWGCVERVIRQDAVDNLYAAPEVSGIAQITAACDWWSVGALLFELLTGKSLVSSHPGGINSHTQLNVPAVISAEAHSLLKELLRFNAKERLGASANGMEDLRSHSFFHGLDWNKVSQSDSEE